MKLSIHSKTLAFLFAGIMTMSGDRCWAGESSSQSYLEWDAIAELPPSGDQSESLGVAGPFVGVSNDAVNFLNSAIGSKAAPLRVILIVAAAGVLAGATFSNGMMEVARKGIFNPSSFYFTEIMIIFLAVMLTDVILLDLMLPDD